MTGAAGAISRPRLVSIQHSDKPLPRDAVWFGEVSLAGEVRPVAHAAIRAREAAKLGFGTATGPVDAEPGIDGLRYSGLRLLPNLVDRILGTP